MSTPKLDRLLNKETDRLLLDIHRARKLFDAIALHGTAIRNGVPVPLSQPDRRDVAQFLFFEVAASWESYAKQCMLIAVRDYYSASSQRAEYILGHPDRGMDSLTGWGSPMQLVERATHLMGKNSEIAILRKIDPGAQLFKRLDWAHKIRNRIAHAGPSDKYRTVLNQLGILPPQSRGVGPGRLLLDYPAPLVNGDRWFDRFMNTYQSVAVRWRVNLL